MINKTLSAPAVFAEIKISNEHLKIFKDILRIKTDRGFGNSLKSLIDDELKNGNHPCVTKAFLENQLPDVLTAIASTQLKDLFHSSEEDELVEQPPTADGSVPQVEQAEAENNLIEFSDLYRK